MMRALWAEQGASLRVEIVADPKVQSFIETHASVLDSSFAEVKMSDGMRSRLQRSDWIFSGMKTFHELNEAFPSLLDEKGERKPFERFLNDVQKINETYNRHYLRAEYNFAQASAQMAARWEGFEADGDAYYLQYRTAGDEKVRETHKALNGITLPMSDPFWKTNYPPNGWNCRCTVVQVRKSTNAPTDSAYAQKMGDRVAAQDKKGMFRFNSGIERRTYPAYNPYTIQKCKTCKQGKFLKMDFIPTDMLCAGCAVINECYKDKAKSESRVLKDHYMREMEHLIGPKHEMRTNTPGETIKVGFSKIGNEHLYSDTFGRSKVLRKEDLKDLDELLQQGTYIDDSVLTHERNDNITRFYYYKAELHGKDVRLNVAKKESIRPNGKPRITYFLYSINDIKE